MKASQTEAIEHSARYGFDAVDADGRYLGNLSESDLKRLLERMAPLKKTLVFTTAGPELAMPPLMSPGIVAKVVTPFETPLVEMIHQYGYPVLLHCHGRIRQALEEFLRCGFDATEPLEPPPQGDLALADARVAAGGRISFLGYVQDQDLHWDTPEHTRAKVTAIAQAVGSQTGFAAMTTCTPFQFPPTPAWVANYVAFLEAAAGAGQ